MAVTTAIGSISKVVREELTYIRKDTEPEVDGIFAALHTTSRGVSTGIGRAWQVIQSFSTGLAGGFKNVNAAGASTLDQSSTGQISLWDASTLRKFPALGDQSSPGYVQKTLTLVQGMGNFSLPLQYFQAETLDATISDAIDLTMKGTAKQVVQSDANNCYASKETTAGNTDGRAIMEFTTTASVTAGTGTNTWTVSLADIATSVGRIARIMPGMMVALHNKGGSGYALVANSDNGVVTKVDYIGKTFTIYWQSSTPSVTAEDILVQGGSEDLGTSIAGLSGIETWLVDSGSPFGLNLTTHPQFKSLVAALGGQVMDGSVLNKYVGGFYDAYGGLYSLDSLITTTGVITSYLDSLDGLFRYERNSRGLTIREGWTSMDYEWNGSKFQYMTSRYQRPGQVYIMKLRDQNLKRYVPPTPAGMGSDPKFHQGIRFMGPLLGSRSIFLPHRASDGALTEFNDAPFVCFREWAPDQLPGVLLTGAAETNP